MEDCVYENESLVSLSNLNPEEDTANNEVKKSVSDVVEKNGEKKEDHDEEKAGIGIIETVTSKLGFVSSPVSSPVAITGDEEMTERNGEEKAGIGIFESVASKLGFSNSVASSAEEEVAERNGEKTEDHQEERESDSVGIIETVASKLGFASSSTVSAEDKEMRNGKKKPNENGEVPKENVGIGLINQIITKLPESLQNSEDQAPVADEAALLISIIDD